VRPAPSRGGGTARKRPLGLALLLHPPPVGRAANLSNGSRLYEETLLEYPGCLDGPHNNLGKGPLIKGRPAADGPLPISNAPSAPSPADFADAENNLGGAASHLVRPRGECPSPHLRQTAVCSSNPGFAWRQNNLAYAPLAHPRKRPNRRKSLRRVF